MPSKSSAISTWIHDVPWQLMATLELPYNLRPSPDTVLTHVNSYLDDVERRVRAQIGSIHVIERRSPYGDPVQAHCHALFASTAPLDPADLESMWHDHLHKANMPGYRTLAEIVQFDKSDNGLLYVCKSLDASDACWKPRHLDYFLPNSELHSRTDHRSLRYVRRVEARMNLNPVTQTA
jgi:hypothetical protein